MILVGNEQKEVESELKIAVGGGALARELNWCVERSRCIDAKRQSLYKAAKQQGSEAAKLFVVSEFVKFLSLLPKRKLLLSPQLTLPNKTIDNCFMRGESSRMNAVNYGYERGGQKYKNLDRATGCAMTNFCEKSIILFRSCFCRSALLCRQGKISCGSLRQLALHEAELKRFEPLSRISNAHYHSQRTAPSPRWGEGIDSVITDNLIETNHSPLTTHYSLKRKAAFTLAEVLITLGIIGVVAAITMPVLIGNVQDRVKQKRVQNIQQKLSNATDLMSVNSGLNGYSDTMSFVQELSKYLKILKICDNSKLEFCWPTKEVSLNDDNKVWEIRRTKNAKTLRIPEKVRQNYSDTVAIVTADGTAIILAYDKTCNFNQDVNGYVYNDGLSNSIGCLAGVFDWNGAKNPNKLGDDVLPIGVALGLGVDCAFETNGKCFSSPFLPTPLSKADCEEQKDKLGIVKGCVWSPDYWAGAVAKCGGVSNMPNANDLLLLAQELYGTKISQYGDNSGITINTSKASFLGFKSVPFGVWSNDEGDAGFSYYREFDAKSSKWVGYGKHGGHPFAVCMDGN